MRTLPMAGFAWEMWLITQPESRSGLADLGPARLLPFVSRLAFSGCQAPNSRFCPQLIHSQMKIAPRNLAEHLRPITKIKVVISKGPHFVSSPRTRCFPSMKPVKARHSFTTATARAAPDDLPGDVERPGTERDRKMDCGHGQDDDDLPRQSRQRDAGGADQARPR